MPFSHHSHSGQFCKHALGSLEDVVLEAIRQRFVVFGLTEHVPRYRLQDLYPEEAALLPKDLDVQFDAFIKEAHRLKVHYATQITLLVGAETELITDADCIGLQALLTRHGDRIEYLVGSIHHVNEVPIDFDQATFQRALGSLASDVEDGHQSQAMCALLEHYLDGQYQLMVRFRPEVIGHLDLCRLYHPDLEFNQFPSTNAKLVRNIRYASEYGALFEVNAAAFRKGWSTAYPGRDVLEIINRHGGRLTISDDSHGPETVGLHYDKLYKYLRDVGVEALWYLTTSKEPETTQASSSSRSVVAKKLDGNWLMHGFWSDKLLT